MILRSSIQTLTEKAASVLAADSFLTLSEELTIHLLALYDAEEAAVLNNDRVSWEVFLNVVGTFLRPGMYVIESMS